MARERIVIESPAKNPESVLDAFLGQHDGSNALLVVPFFFAAYWNDSPSHSFTALYLITSFDVYAAVLTTPLAYCDAGKTFVELPAQKWRFDNVASEFKQLVEDARAATISLSGAFQLCPVDVAKPWGKEVWFTGIEKRGVACVASESGQSLLPHILALAPKRLCNGLQRDLVLLKVLAPFAHETLGDLYTELHTNKWETYVVTQVDRSAWPSGVGKMFYGLSREKLAAYDNDDSKLRRAYLDAVRRYEKVRRAIDSRLEDWARNENVKYEDLSLETRVEWSARIPTELQLAEKKARAEMESFVGVLDVREGDVIQVPAYTIHSLCHGIRVIEFQSQSYERYIVSFKQKVLTQSHWDSEEGINAMRVVHPELVPGNELRNADGVIETRVVEFPEFSANRLRIRDGASATIDAGSAPYALVFAVKGILKVTTKSKHGTTFEKNIGPGNSAFVPLRDITAWLSPSLKSEDDSICFYAFPNSQDGAA